MLATMTMIRKDENNVCVRRVWRDTGARDYVFAPGVWEVFAIDFTKEHTARKQTPIIAPPLIS